MNAPSVWTYALLHRPFQPTVVMWACSYSSDPVELGTVDELFFDAPEPSRADALVRARTVDRPRFDFRTPKSAISKSVAGEERVVYDNLLGYERLTHTILVSNTFALHPAYGTGHVLRTNGVSALFWNGEEVVFVHVTNLQMLQVRLDHSPLGKRSEHEECSVKPSPVSAAMKLLRASIKV